MQKKITWADHIVVIYPVWWDKLLTGKTARIISTMGQPPWYYYLIYSSPSDRAVKKLTLEFCGVKPVKMTSIGPIRLSKETFRKKWLDKVEALGLSQF